MDKMLNKEIQIDNGEEFTYHNYSHKMPINIQILLSVKGTRLHEC